MGLHMLAQRLSIPEPGNPRVMTDMPTAETFAPHVGKSFQPHGWHGSLMLVSIDSRKRPGWDEQPVVPFSLLWRGPRGDVLPEGFHTYDVEGGPECAFYITPIHTPAKTHQDYQAAFM